MPAPRVTPDSPAAARRSWGRFLNFLWLPLAVFLETRFRDGAMLAVCLLPLAWLLWVNLREHVSLGRRSQDD